MKTNPFTAAVKFKAYRPTGAFTAKPITISLKDGQEKVFSVGGPDEEGWWRRTFIYRREGDKITHTALNSGRDCDGVSRYGYEEVADAKPNLSGRSKVRKLKFRTVDVELYDQFAENMNY